MGGNSKEGVLWKVVDIEGKGKGVIAKVDIEAGTLIVEETPIFIIPREIHYTWNYHIAPHKHCLNFQLCIV